MSQTQSIQYFRFTNSQKIGRLDQDIAAKERSTPQKYDQTKTRMLWYQIISGQTQYFSTSHMQATNRQRCEAQGSSEHKFKWTNIRGVNVFL